MEVIVINGPDPRKSENTNPKPENTNEIPVTFPNTESNKKLSTEDNKQEKDISNLNSQQEEIDQKLNKDENSTTLIINKEVEKNMDIINKDNSQNNIEIKPVMEEKNEKKIDNDAESGYIDLNKILNEKNDSSSMNNLNNNNVYVTEANIIKENKNFETPDVRKKTNASVKKNNSTIKKTKMLDSLSPIIHKKKIDSEVNLVHLQYRLKKMEENLQKQNDYDYKRIMKEIDLQRLNKKKEIEHQKEINEKNQKFSEKLKVMESYREKALKDKIQKIIDKQKLKLSTSKNSINLNESPIKTEAYEKKSKTIDVDHSSRKKLPDISVKYKLIRQMKKENEDNFCFETEEKLKYLEDEHRKNHISYLRKRDEKIQEFSEKYNERNLKCILAKKDNENERKENYMNQYMLKRLRYKELALEKKNEQINKLSQSLKKNIYNFQDKKEILENKEKEKIQKYLKHLNRKSSISNLKKSHENYLFTDTKKELLLNKQKENLNNIKEENKLLMQDYLYDQEYYVYLLKNIGNSQAKKTDHVYKNIVNYQKEKDKNCRSSLEIMDEIGKDNILNKNLKLRMKLYNQRKREEKEKLEENNEEIKKNKIQI